MKSSIGWLAAAAVCLGAAGCAANKKLVKAPEAPAAAPTESAQEPSMRNTVLHQVPELETVHFAYDSARLDQASRDTLASNAAWLKDRPELQIQVAGHCDQRGTIEYNLALGDRRAKSVRDYYMRVGVPGDRVATISYGKERPLCDQQEESCWKQNRRAETWVAYPAAVSKSQ